MLTSNKLLLATAILATTLTACDKKDPAKTETAPVATTATSTTTATTVTKTAESTTAPISTVAPVSSVAVSGVASVTPVAESAVTPTVETTTTKTEIKETATVASSTPSVKFPATKGKSIVAQAVKSGTPEATVKNMMDAMMTGTPQQVASYYGVDDPTLEPMIEPMLAEQQPMVQQQAKSLQLGEVEYNKDKTKAIIVGKMTLNDKTTKQVGYKLQKIDGQWKLMP